MDREKAQKFLPCPRFRPPGYCFPPKPYFTVRAALSEDTRQSTGASLQTALARKRGGEQEG